MNEKDQFIEKIKPDISNFTHLIRNNRRFQEGNVKSFSLFNSPIEGIVASNQVTDFYDIITKIAYYEDFNGSFSTKYVEKKLFELLHKILCDHSRDDEYIGELYTNFIDNSKNNWRVIAQLENVRFVERAVFKLIDSTLKFMKPEDLSVSINSLQRDLFGPHYSNWVLSHCIYTDVTAGDQLKAEELAIDNFNLSLNLLRLYFPNLNISIKRPISMSDTQEKIAYEIISINITKKDRNISEKNDKKKCVDLSPKIYDYLVKNGIDSLSNNSQIDCALKISDVVKDCLYWYGLALNTSLLSAKFLHYVTILEAGLKLNGEDSEVTQKIASRCSLFLETDVGKRREIRKEIIKIYDLRSKVVHTGRILGKKSEKELDDIASQMRLTESASIYARNVLIKLIRENNERKGDFEKLIKDLDNMNHKKNSLASSDK